MNETVNKYRREVFELFEELEELETDQERIDYIQANSKEQAFLDVLRGSFDPSLVFNLPEGAPPYKPCLPESFPSTLHRGHKDFAWFIKGTNADTYPSYKREQKFLNLLESIHPSDAKLVISMVEKNPPFDGLTVDLVKEALPNLIKA